MLDNVRDLITYRVELRKRDKIHRLFDFCREINSMMPVSVCESSYLAKFGNVAVVKFWSQDENYPGLGKRANKFNIRSRDMYTQKVVGLLFVADLGEEFEFLNSGPNTLMRNAGGEIFQIENYSDYPPKIISAKLSPEIRKTFERIYDEFYTDNLPKLEKTPSSLEFREALVDTVDTEFKKLEIAALKKTFTLVRVDKNQN